MQSFRELVVWQKAHRLTLDVYRICKSLPDGEKFGLISQLQRSSASIPTNIAEGSGRSGPGDFARFLDYAAGSTSEVEYQICLCEDLGYVDSRTSRDIQSRCVEVRKMLCALRARLTTD